MLSNAKAHLHMLMPRSEPGYFGAQHTYFALQGSWPSEIWALGGNPSTNGDGVSLLCHRNIR